MPQNTDLFVLYRQGDAQPHKKLSWENLLAGVGGIVPPETEDPTNTVHVGETAPPSPHEGDLWFKPNGDAANSGVLYLYYVTPTTGVVDSVSIRNGGSGYIQGSQIRPTWGSGHELTLNVVTVDGRGVITEVSVDNGGHGYESGDLVYAYDSGHGNASFVVTGIGSSPDGAWLSLMDGGTY